MGSIGRNVITINTITNSSPKVATAVERAFRKANLIEGESTDLYKVIYSYKALQNLPQNQIEVIYDYLAERLGFRK